MRLEERDHAYLRRIYEYCARIDAAKQRFGDTFENYSGDADYRDVVCMNIFQIGELANQLSDETREKLNDIPWTQMYAIRNIFAHAYIKVDDRIVWDTVINDIPALQKRLDDIL